MAVTDDTKLESPDFTITFYGLPFIGHSRGHRTLKGPFHWRESDDVTGRLRRTLQCTFVAYNGKEYGDWNYCSVYVRNPKADMQAIMDTVLNMCELRLASQYPEYDE